MNDTSKKTTSLSKTILIQFGESNPQIINNQSFPNNIISSTKYNLFNFLPKATFIQFRKIANLYCLIICILSFFNFSTKSPVSQVLPLILTISMSIFIEGYEDFQRNKLDQKANLKEVYKLSQGKFVKIECYKLIPGDIIKVEKDDEIPADFLLINSSNKNGNCFINSTSLDGETSLKEKISIEIKEKNQIDFKEKYTLSLKTFTEIQGKIECDSSNENLSSWEGILYLKNTKIFCSMRNLILKGCILKNTNWVFGVIIYSGSNTKIMKNSRTPSKKMSQTYKLIDKLLYVIFSFHFILSLIFALSSLSWSFLHKNEVKTYCVACDYNDNFVYRFFSYFVTIYNLIPKSPYLSLEIIQLFQSLFIHHDEDITDNSLKRHIDLKTSQLLEDLGCVDNVFSDKTGTLTQNELVLRKIYVKGKIFGQNIHSSNWEEKYTINGDNSAALLLKDNFQDDKMKINIEEFFTLLAICNSITTEKDKENIIFKSCNPDDIALVKAAKIFGIELLHKDEKSLTIYNHFNKKETNYEIKLEIPFDYDRRRSTVIVQDRFTKEILLLCKGADTTVLKLLDKDSTNEINRIDQANREFNKEGLRVIVLASKKINLNQFLMWERDYNAAKSKPILMIRLINELEKDLTLIGSSATEDKLQEEVPETIKTLLSCNIKFWMLTGDNKELSHEIAKSCNLINENFFLVDLCQDDIDESFEEIIEQLINEFKIDLSYKKMKIENTQAFIIEKRKKEMAIIIDGNTLDFIFGKEELWKKFFCLSSVAKSVICCRISPKQKSTLVKKVKSNTDKVVLAIGDGDNDVPMILTADIGVGIIGKEGTHAVSMSDFSLSKFKYLQKLLLIYGRSSYIKISNYLNFYLYKNFILIFTEMWFSFYNGFSAQPYFADWIYILYGDLTSSWPCIVVFLMQIEVNLDIAKRFPFLYESGRKNLYFNIRIISFNLLCALIHGTIIFFLVNESLNFLSNGGKLDHWDLSIISVSIIMNTVTLKLLLLSEYWNIISMISLILSICIFYLGVFIQSLDSFSQVQNELIGSFMILTKSYTFYLSIFLGSILTILPDLTYTLLNRIINPFPLQGITRNIEDPIFKNKFMLEKVKNSELTIANIKMDNDKTRSSNNNKSNKYFFISSAKEFLQIKEYLENDNESYNSRVRLQNDSNLELNIKDDLSHFKKINIKNDFPNLKKQFENIVKNNEKSSFNDLESHHTENLLINEDSTHDKNIIKIQEVVRSIYEEVGGAKGIEAAVDLFYQKILANDDVNYIFQEINLSQLKKHQRHFLTFATGGPNNYAGRNMRDAHLKLNLKENHFNVVAQILRETLLEIGVNEKIPDTIMNKIAGLKNDVLNLNSVENHLIPNEKHEDSNNKDLKKIDKIQEVVRSIYEEVGGAKGIEAAVDLFYQKIIADDEVNYIFQEINLSQLKKHQRHFLTFATGGPNNYAGRNMRDAHLKLNLKENHFNVVARILRETLLEIGVNEKITDSIMNKIAGLKNDVLNI